MRLLQTIALALGLSGCSTYQFTEKVYEGQFSGHNVHVKESFLDDQPMSSEVTVGSTEFLFGKLEAVKGLDYLCAQVIDNLCFAVTGNNPPRFPLVHTEAVYDPSSCEYGNAETDPNRGDPYHESCYRVLSYDLIKLDDKLTAMLNKFGVNSLDEIEELLREARDAVKSQPEALKQSETRREWRLLL